MCCSSKRCRRWASIRDKNNAVQTASRIHRVWASSCRQTLLCLQNHWCQGETGSIWWNTALVLPLAFSKRREVQKNKIKTEGKLKKEKARGASRRKKRETRQDELCKAVRGGYCWGVLAVLKRASPDLHKLHQPLSPLPVAESCLNCAPANGQQQNVYAREGHTWWLWGCWGGVSGQGQARPLGGRWIVLEGHISDDKYTLYYHYLQRSPTGRSELICTAAPWKYNYWAKAHWIVAISALWSAVTTHVSQNALCAEVRCLCELSVSWYLWLSVIFHLNY